jgi:hypothetical protein
MGRRAPQRGAGTLSELDLSDSRTPSWPQPKLDVPLQQLYACLAIYVATLAIFWLQVAKVFVRTALRARWPHATGE